MAGDDHQPHLARCSRTARTGVRAKCVYAHPSLGIMWGSGLRVKYSCTHDRGLLPTKTSLIFIHLFGRSPSFARTCSQVFTTRLVNPLFLFILVAINLSSESLELIARSHLDWISWWLWIFSWITLSQRRTQIRKADSRSIQSRYLWSRYFTSCTRDLGPLRVVCTHVPLFPQFTHVTVTEDHV